MTLQLPPSSEDFTYRPKISIAFDGYGTGYITLTDEVSEIEVERFVFAATPERKEVIRESVSILEKELHLHGMPDNDLNWLSLNPPPKFGEVATSSDLVLDIYDTQQFYENALSLALGMALERSKKGTTNDHE